MRRASSGGVRSAPPADTAPEVPSAFAPPDFAELHFRSANVDGAAAISGRSLRSVQDIDDDIDELDTIDVDLFPIFAEEALELLPKLGSALRQWVARPDNSSARAEVLRNLHTLKGSARLAGALRLGEMAHRMETDAERLDLDVASKQPVEPLLTAFDAIVARFELLRGMDPESHGVVQVAPEHAAPSEAAETASCRGGWKRRWMARSRSAGGGHP